tara:strand:- start:1571 stop:1843 length:273 start_codon:yes stop_codon:yes gene_type:complete
MKKNSLFFIFLILIIGMMVGTIMSLTIGALLPEGTVKDFFMLTKSFGWGVNENNWIEMGFLRFKTGMYIDVSILSSLGFLISWYILRYFK